MITPQSLSDHIATRVMAVFDRLAPSDRERVAEGELPMSKIRGWMLQERDEKGRFGPIRRIA